MTRTKIFRVDIQAVAKWMKGHYALPNDAVYKGAEYDPKSGKLSIELQHQTFEMVKHPPLVNGEGSGDSKEESKSTKKASKKK